MLIPSSAGATLTGTTTLDGQAIVGPPNLKTFQYELTGGPYTNQVVATAKPTIYGWLAQEPNDTWGWDSTSVPNGTYTVTPTVTFSNGETDQGKGVTVTVSNPAPTARVLIPSSGATLSSPMYLAGEASYQQNITKFTYDVDGAPIGTATLTIDGWLLQWNPATVAKGSHTISAVATYADGATATSPGISVTVT
jgi:PKD repeat protein